MNDRPGVTVAIPCYNQAEYLEEALSSVARQTLSAQEIIVIDDGSDPIQANEIARICDSYSASRYRVVNRGLPNARNTALMLCRTQAFLPLDADDWLGDRYLEMTWPLMQRGDVDVVLVGLQEHGPTRNSSYMPGYDRPWQDVTPSLMLASYNRFFYCSLLRSQLLREVGGYNGRLAGWPGKVHGGYEDWSLWIDLLRRNARFEAVLEVLFHYRTRPGSMLSSAESNRDVLVAEIRRHHGWNH